MDELLQHSHRKNTVTLDFVALKTKIIDHLEN